MNRLLIVSVVAATIKGQTLMLSPNPVEIGSSFTVNCLDSIDSGIEFFLNSVSKGTCPIPFGPPGICSPPEIGQDQQSGNTSWTVSAASLADQGVWNCTGISGSSNQLELKMFKCPATAVGTGISANLILNETTKIDIAVDLDCSYSPNSQKINLHFQPTSGAEYSVDLNCTMASSTCSVGLFAYQCTHEIAYSHELKTGTDYSLAIEFEPTIGTCNRIDLFSSHKIKFIIEGQTLSTHLTPTSDVGRSSQVVPKDGGIHSLITISNSPNETMPFSTIFLAITDTSSLIFQSSASSDISPYYISNTYTPTYLMSTLTTNIFDSRISLPLSRSGAFLGHCSKSSLKSTFDTMTSDLSIFSVLYSASSIIDALESSNLISLSNINRVDSITDMTFTVGNRISSFVDSAYTSVLKSLTSVSLSDSDSLTQDPRSQITTLPYRIFLTQKETGSHIDYTPLTSFTYTDNSQSSLDIFYQPSLPPSFASHMTGLSTQTLLCNHSMQSEESLTIPTTLSNLETNSMLMTTFAPDEASILFYLSSEYITSADLRSSFDFDAKTKNSTKGTSTSNIIDTMTLNSIAESHETKSAQISMNYDFSSSTFINSPITSFGSTPGTPSMVDINTSVDSLLESFEDKPSTSIVNSLQTRSLSESETVGIIMSTSVETSNENTDTLLESSFISPSTAFNHMHESLSLDFGIESDTVYKATSSAYSVLFNSFSILPEKDSDNVLSTTSDVVVWSRDVSRTSPGGLSPIGPSSHDSTAYISTKYMLSISINSDKYSSATNTHFSQPRELASIILPSVSNYLYFSDTKKVSSSLLMTSSVNKHSVITSSPSLTKSSKVIAISVTAVGCIMFVAITILVLFVLKLLQCKPRSKISKTDKKFNNTDCNSLSIKTRGWRETSLFERPYGLPTRYSNQTATSWGVNDNQFTCTYNKNWDDII